LGDRAERDAASEPDRRIPALQPDRVRQRQHLRRHGRARPKHVPDNARPPGRTARLDVGAARICRARFFEEGAMRRFALAFALLIPVALAACQKEEARIPAPRKMTAEAIGHYCGMNLFEHPGPKGQIFAASLIEPVWFSSARDAIAFTMLPDEPK